MELFDITGTSWGRDSVVRTYYSELGLGHGVVSWICHDFIPDKSDGLELEAPCFENVDGYVELWSSSPHEADTLMVS